MSSCPATHSSGTSARSFEYSNLGGGLLGHVLARRAGASYEDVIRTRITQAAGDEEHEHRVVGCDEEASAVGHNDRMAPVPNWDLPALAGAGALRSTANDLLNFLESFSGLQTIAPRAGDEGDARR